MLRPSLSCSDDSTQNRLDDVPVHIGQPALDAVVVVAQPLVIESEEMQDGRVQVVNRADVFDRLMAEFVGRRRG
jgi:hypothetical protein